MHNLLQTFSKNRPSKDVALRETAGAGFYSVGDNDRVVCFCCAGGLKNWEPNENPCYKHAKWYPMSGFAPRCQGAEYVKEVCLKFRRLNRLQLTHTSKSNAAKEI